MTDNILHKTPLHALHLELGAKMVPFAGYDMPVQYPTGVMTEHKHTRASAGLFDVSHMGQVRITGDQAAQIMETVVPVSVEGIKPGQQRYALFTNDAGGIQDDLMIANAGDHLFVVVNAACKAQDFALLEDTFAGKCDVEILHEQALLALQGPQAIDVLQSLSETKIELTFMQCGTLDLAGIRCFISRSGYSGEDGFEISVAAESADLLARKLLAHDAVLPIGLGARDSLRLEAGLCLYGHDIDTTTTPLEADLGWAIQKVRRNDGARAGGFPGAEKILAEYDSGVSRKRVGILPNGRAPVREGAELQTLEGETIGTITSGGFGPTLGAPVAMGYVASQYAQTGTELHAIVRGKALPVTVADMPFVPQRYYRG